MATVVQVRHADPRAAVVPLGGALIAGISVLLNPAPRQLRAGLAGRDADHHLADQQCLADIEAFAEVFMSKKRVGLVLIDRNPGLVSDESRSIPTLWNSLIPSRSSLEPAMRIVDIAAVEGVAIPVSLSP